MENVSSKEYLEARDSYDNTVNVIDKLNHWKKELEKKVTEDPRDVEAHGLISEIELSISRLKFLAGSEIRNAKPKLVRIEDTPDDYDYRLMCEWGYSDREKWEDAKSDGMEIKVKAGDYIIGM
ncbi:hypothetical protein [Reinekea sp. G2M2-21]|uniref:hypothetical protein n=1 Tax=Reinekea sp. G2M2-21 TaxID=2788942 RepID=UPI0018A8DAE2|nr:hypothetical protein [Reinekea sp. G2M2-21]